MAFEQFPSRGGNANRPRLGGGFHPGGKVDGVAPDIVLIFSTPDHSGDDGPDMDTNTDLPIRRQTFCGGDHRPPALDTIQGRVWDPGA